MRQTLNNPAFWSMLVAVLALILSQLPPVRQLIRGKKLRLAVSELVGVTHSFGNTNMNLWVDLENTGGRTITIKRIKCFLKLLNGPTQVLTAMTYYLTESFSQDKEVQLPLSEIALKPGDRWSGFLHLWDVNTWTRATEAKFKAVKRAFQEDLDKKLAALANVPIDKRPLVEIEPPLQREAEEIVKNVRRLDQGEYRFWVSAYEQESGSPIQVAGYEFTLFEADVSQIFENLSDFRYGFGVNLQTRKHGLVAVIARPQADGGRKEFDTLAVPNR